MKLLSQFGIYGGFLEPFELKYIWIYEVDFIAFAVGRMKELTFPIDLCSAKVERKSIESSSIKTGKFNRHKEKKKNYLVPVNKSTDVRKFGLTVLEEREVMQK